MRLDIYLTQQDPSYSRSFYQKFIKSVGIMVNKKRVKKPHLELDDIDTVHIDKAVMKKFMEALTPALPKEVPTTPLLYSSKNFFVIDKPAGVRTEHVVGDYLPVHRLDKDTSGVLVIAKNMQTQAALQKQWQQRSVKKAYIALIKGHLTPQKGAIEGSIIRSLHDRRKMTLSKSIKARAAFTEYEVSEYLEVPSIKEKLTLIKALPATGRTHQIRVHFQHIKHPIICDALYGDEKLNKKIEHHSGLKRHFLHAASLTIVNPDTKKEVTFTAPLPKDLVETLGSLKP